MKIKKVYNKAQSTGQTKKQENQQGIHQKTSKRACRVLKKCKKEKKKTLDRRNQDYFAPE